MKNQTENIHNELASVIKTVGEMNQLSSSLRKAYLESNRHEFSKLFLEYLNSEGPIEKPSLDAIELGFKDSWVVGKYEDIAQVGDRLPEGWLEKFRLVQAFYMAAKHRLEKSG